VINLRVDPQSFALFTKEKRGTVMLGRFVTRSLSGPAAAGAVRAQGTVTSPSAPDRRAGAHEGSLHDAHFLPSRADLDYGCGDRSSGSYLAQTTLAYVKPARLALKRT